MLSCTGTETVEYFVGRSKYFRSLQLVTQRLKRKSMRPKSQVGSLFIYSVKLHTDA